DPITGSALACVCVPAAKAEDSERLRREIAAVVATRFGAPFRPKRVLLVSALPKTRNEKIMRRIVRAILSDTDLGDLSSLVNPDAIDELRAVAAASRYLRERHKDLD
ncbi:MAG TPA: hypothetical protein VII92_07660, partial [Anaerolineae bacterium]